MNPQMSSYGHPPQQQQQPQWSQAPPASTLNGNAQPNIIPQLVNMNLGGGGMYDPKQGMQQRQIPQHQPLSQPPQQQFSGFASQMPPPMSAQMIQPPQQQQQRPPQMQNGPPQTGTINNNPNSINNNNQPMRPSPSLTPAQNGPPQMNGTTSTQQQQQPPGGQYMQAAVLPVKTETIDSNQYPIVSNQIQPHLDRLPAQSIEQQKFMTQQQSMSMSGAPPPTMGGPPPTTTATMSGPPPTTTMSGLPPTTTMSGPPPTTMSGQPLTTNSGPPPSLMGGPPQTSMSGPPVSAPSQIPSGMSNVNLMSGQTPPPPIIPISQNSQLSGIPGIDVPKQNTQMGGQMMSGLPPKTNPQNYLGQQPSFQQSSGFPPISAAGPGQSQQQPPNAFNSMAATQSGPPQQQAGFPPQHVGPPQQQAAHPQQTTQPQKIQPNYPPLPTMQQPQTSGYASVPAQQPQMSGFPASQGMPPQPTGFPPQPQGFPSQGQPAGYPPMPGQPPQQSSFPGFNNQQPMPGSMPGSMAGQMPGQPVQQPHFYSTQQQPPQSYPPGPGQPPIISGQPYSGGMPGLPHMPPQKSSYAPGQMMPPGPGGQMPVGPIMAQGPLPPGQQGRNIPPGAYNQMPGQYPSQGNQSMAAQQRRLDPDQMPNPIEVMNENDNTFSGPFITNQPGLVPPLVTTEFITQDQGNTGPRFMRSSMYNIPSTSDMIKQTAVPFSLIISPFAKTVAGELTPPIVNFGEIGPIRCIRCKAYMSPNMQFIDAGRRFQCLMCKATTEVPAEYFQHLDHAGQRVDKYERPELVLGTYEFSATKDYCRDNKTPNPPALIFIIDVSYNNIKSGLVNLLCAEMKRIIRNLPVDQNCDKSFMKVGFITYNNTVHFYNIKNNLAQPQMLVVGDVQEMFMPLLDGFLCDPEESNIVIDALMDQIPKMFGDSRETETILLPAIQAGLEALKASECAGKLLVFNSSLPSADAPGKLKNRDDRKLLGTEKEKTVLVPQSTAYNNLGQDCVQAGCSVDLFIFNNSYIDIATIGQVSRLTGGEVFKYTYFQADIDGSRLIGDIIKNVSRPIGFDAVMRVRTSAGIRPTDFYGHFFMSNTTDIELASIDADKSIAIEIKHDDKLPPEENVYIQVALLYTSCSGQRRLRILNLCVKVCVQMTDMFRSCDLDSIILFFAKQSIFKLMDSNPKAIKDNLISRCAQILACYRKNCATPISAGQLILPECMKLLPLYTSCLLKNDSISGGSDMTVDDRSYIMQLVLTMALPTSVTFIYPRLVPIHDVDPAESDTLPPQVRCSVEKMQDNGAYILENGVYMFIWLGSGLSTEFCQSVFGVPTCQQIDTDRCEIPELDNPISLRVRNIVNFYQQISTRCMRITLVRQRDKLENVFRHFLIEDRGTDGSPSYVDFLCHMHKEIRALLS